MPKITRFEDLTCWQEARKIVNDIYEVSRINEFRKDFGLADQVKRAAVSIMANISEGFSRRGNKEFIQFLFISKASAAELQSHLYVALDQGYLKQENFSSLYENIDKVQRQISNLIKYLTQTLKRNKHNKPNQR